MWLEISALAIRKRSIAAMTRENSEEEGARATDAVFDIRGSFLETVSSAVSFRKGSYVYQMPKSMHAIAWQHALFRIAA